MEYPFSSEEREVLNSQGAFEAVRTMIRNRIEEIDDMSCYRDDVAFQRTQSLHNLISYIRGLAIGGRQTEGHPLTTLNPESTRLLLDEAGYDLSGEVISYEELCLRENTL
jgi:hypothetical protein